MLKRVIIPAVVILVFTMLGPLSALAQSVSLEDALSGRVRVKLVKVPRESRVRNGASSACWTTNDLNVPPYQGGWPPTREFFPGDLLAYATGTIRVTAQDPGPHTVTLHVENFATLRGTYSHLTRADLDGSFDIYNDAGAAYTDWYLAVYRNLPEFLQIFPDRIPVDWTTAVGGYVSYSCSGSITVGPRPESGRASLSEGASPIFGVSAQAFMATRRLDFRSLLSRS